MLRIVLFTSVLAFLAACSNEPEKVMDLSEKIPKSTRNYDVDTTQNAQESDHVAGFRYKKMFPDGATVKELESSDFIDRFRPVATEKVRVFTAGDSVDFKRWIFKDSIKTKSAFYNWMDMVDVSYFGAKEAIQKEAFVMLYSDTAIVWLSGAIDFKDWRKKIKEEKWLGERDFLIEQRNYGKARWYRWESDEFIELKEE